MSSLMYSTNTPSHKKCCNVWRVLCLYSWRLEHESYKILEVNTGNFRRRSKYVSPRLLFFGTLVCTSLHVYVMYSVQ